MSKAAAGAAAPAPGAEAAAAAPAAGAAAAPAAAAAAAPAAGAEGAAAAAAPAAGAEAAAGGQPAAAAAAAEPAAGAAAAAAGAAKAPAAYTLKVPDGGLIDASDLPQLEKVARANDMTNEEAQAYLDEMGVTVKAQSDGYLAALKADPDYGGDKLAESQRLATAFVDRMRPVGHARRDSFLKFLNRGGALNHPEVVALLADAGKMMSEDGHVGGAAPRGGKVTTASKMYDHPTSVAADAG